MAERDQDAALVNVLGAVALAIADGVLGERAVAGLPPPLDHPTASAALSLVRWLPGLPMADLAHYLQLSQPATVRVVQRLGSARLAETRRDRGDRRLRVYPTPAGLAAAAQLDRRRAGVLREAIRGLASAERGQLLDLLERIAAGLPHDMTDAMHVCRLCHWESCGQGRCPVANAVIHRM